MQIKTTTFNCENLFGHCHMPDFPRDKRSTGYEFRLQIFDVIVPEIWRSGKIRYEEILLFGQSVIIKSSDFFRQGLTSRSKQYKGWGLSLMDGNDLKAGDRCAA
ncbi:MAG: hypothetical protein ACM3H8_10480 [Sphingobacteriales bacterium]